MFRERIRRVIIPLIAPRWGTLKTQDVQNEVNLTDSNLFLRLYVVCLSLSPLGVIVSRIGFYVSDIYVSYRIVCMYRIVLYRIVSYRIVSYRMYVYIVCLPKRHVTSTVFIQSFHDCLYDTVLAKSPRHSLFKSHNCQYQNTVKITWG